MEYFFFFKDTATTEIYTLSLHDALPISPEGGRPSKQSSRGGSRPWPVHLDQGRLSSDQVTGRRQEGPCRTPDRKSTRLNSSHANISYAVFCLKKKKTAHKYQ